MKENLFGGIYKNKKAVITGNTGFKGSWLALWLREMGANVYGFSRDDHGSGSHFKILNAGYETCYADIRNKKDLDKFLIEVNPDIVFHLAAQSLVRESYRNPFETYETNVMGTLNVFQAAAQCSITKAVVNVTTDKVYANTNSSEGYSEANPLGGHDMYSSSKACSEILSESFRKSFLENNSYLLATARAGNVIGGGDSAPDRLIPDAIRAVQKKQTVSIRNPVSVRPWQHVLEPLSGYLLLGQKLLEGKKELASSWNFGPEKNDSASVKEVLDIMHAKWEMISWKHENPGENFHEAGLLKLDSSKAKKELGWSPVWNLEKSIEQTVSWYKDFLEKKEVRSIHDLAEYIKDATSMKKTWTA